MVFWDEKAQLAAALKLSFLRSCSLKEPIPSIFRKGKPDVCWLSNCARDCTLGGKVMVFYEVCVCAVGLWFVCLGERGFLLREDSSRLREFTGLIGAGCEEDGSGESH